MLKGAEVQAVFCSRGCRNEFMGIRYGHARGECQQSHSSPEPLYCPMPPAWGWLDGGDKGRRFSLIPTQGGWE